MVKIQFDIPEEINSQLLFEKAKRKIKDKRKLIIALLYEKLNLTIEERTKSFLGLR
jgi:hypothetical protein